MHAVQGRLSKEDRRGQAPGEEEKKRRDGPWYRFWRSLVDRVHNAPEGFGGLTWAEQTYFAINVLHGEIYNGGFVQYFSNSSADCYPRAVDGLKELGATQSLKLLLEAKETLFGANPVPPKAVGAVSAVSGYERNGRSTAGLVRAAR
jgi:hypothetical protein